MNLCVGSRSACCGMRGFVSRKRLPYSAPAGSDLAKAAIPQCAEHLFPRMLDCEKMIAVEDERAGAI